tara:strand:- start:13227 stop:13547 length:321 start_codon:yes stop_codon:yes gene_type:complete
MEQFASTYMELGFAGIVAVLFGFMIINLIKSQNAQSEDLEKIKQDLTKLSTEMSNTQSISIKIVDRFNLTDRTSQSHREAVVKELNELSQDIAEVKGSVSRINGRH